MLKLPAMLACRAGAFEKILKRELEALPAGTLPLHRGTSRGGYVDDSDISTTVIHVEQGEHRVLCKVGIFFTEIIAGCSCGDDPFTENAYCELMVSIDKTTAETEIEVIH
ncbi:MAG: glucosamine--fructose-6-phosphate aminotransferase [Gammaproteobacteria bacterium]|nr:glucosamine--fructose-6-phosphate aminotransferase [Gammaproteobacteria bacterium]